MRYLLDTHILIWALSEPSHLPQAVREGIEQPANEVFVSAASAWEIALKAGLGKVELPIGELATAVAQAGFVELPVTVRHALAVRDLPPLHRDPFDRLLVAQALLEGLVLVTHDRQLAAYPAETLAC